MSHCPFPFLERNFLNVAYLKLVVKVEQSVSCWDCLWHNQTGLVSVLAMSGENPGLKFTVCYAEEVAFSHKFIHAFVASK